MLNIGKLRRGGENYYLNSVARGVEDYYLGSGEAPGYWLASGAEELGLSGEVTERELRNVLNGRDANTGRLLITNHKAERVPGFDLTFRVPKSVSLLHALGPKEASNDVVSAHDAAIAAALKYLEQVASGARRGRGGKRSIESDGFIGAAFRHRSSRAGDPLLHTHVLVANLIKGKDGKWGALDARHIYMHAKTAGYLYQAHLRAELTRRLGVEWTPVRNGAADIEGISRKVIRGFSKRRREIEEKTGDQKVSRKAAEMAALTTRKAKDYEVSPEALADEWRHRAEQLGLTPEVLEATLDKVSLRPPDAAELNRMAGELSSAQGLTAQTSTFSRREAIQGFCAQLQAGAKADDVVAMADEFLATDHVVPLSTRRGDLSSEEKGVPVSAMAASVEEARYSTHEMLATERAVIERAARRLADCGIADQRALEASLAKRPSMFPDQQAMVQRLTTSGLGVEAVVGKAGAGKTFALDAARETWERSGYRVIGCSLSARAAQELHAGSGIESHTIARLLQDLGHETNGGFGTNTVLVVDEAGMVGTRDLQRLLSHAERDGTKVVLVGDDRQLPEIQAGGAYRGIKDRLPELELSEVRRQPFGWERDALDLIRKGLPKEAIDAYSLHDRVFMAKSGEETRRCLVLDWWESQSHGTGGVMIAARRSDVEDLNTRARQLMSAAGRLDSISIEAAGHCFAKGDRVMTLKNNRGLGVINGTKGEVTHVDPQRQEVTLRAEDGRSVTLPSDYLEAGHLTHSYAITGHKAQGMTAQEAFVLGDETLYKEWAYVAMSRGRSSNRLYVVAGIDPDRDELGGQVEKIADPREELVRSLGKSRAKHLAIDSLESQDLGRNPEPIELERTLEV